MDTIIPSSQPAMGFEQAAQHLSGIKPDVIASIAASAADVALLLKDGVIEDMAVGNAGLSDEGFGTSWRGAPWIDTVTPDSRGKVEEILRDQARVSRWRQVNHPSVTALDLPVRYTAIRLDNDGRLLALGRDMRAESKLQQRLVEAHQDLERDYTRLREAEARYRLLFETVSEPVLIANANALTIDEANGAAGALIGRSPKALAGLPIAALGIEAHASEINRGVSESLLSGSGVVSDITLSNGVRAALHISAFREDRATRLIVRIVTERAPATRSERSKLFETLEMLPDGLIVVDAGHRVVAANQAFFDMVKIAGKTQATGASLGDFLGRSTTDLNVLFSTLKNHGVVRNYATRLRDVFGDEDVVEVSAVATQGNQNVFYGLSIRNVSRRLQAGNRMGEQLPQSVEQVTEQVGRVPLREIVRESTELIEKLCIEAALEITEQNRASAAEMLGLSRQGLYTKLKRAGIDS